MEVGMLRFVALAVLLGASVTHSHAALVTFSASGANATDIQATVDSFRTASGALNPNVVGSLGTGRREINWDGVPDALSASNNLPANFFNVNSPRGVVFSTPGTGFQVSANAATATPVEFGNIIDMCISNRHQGHKKAGNAEPAMNERIRLGRRVTRLVIG